MINETNIWKLQSYSERAWKISSDLAVEAGKLGRNGVGIGVVANEARKIADVLFNAIDKMKDGGDFNVDLSVTLWQMNQLLQNGVIETIRVGRFEESIQNSKPVSVAMENMRILQNNLVELLEDNKVDYLATPEVTQPSTITDTSVFLFQSTIGGVHFVENARYVVELVVYSKDDGIQDGELMVRGKKMPVIDCYSKFGLINHEKYDTSFKCAAIINTDWHTPDKKYAVLVDDFATNSIFRSKIGMRSEPKSIAFSKEYIRESWDAAENKQFVFLDWVNILNWK